MTSLAEQIVEIEKTVRDRVRTYPAMIERRRLLPETAEAKLAAMRAVQSTLLSYPGPKAQTFCSSATWPNL
jgi:hypothetical protein